MLISIIRSSRLSEMNTFIKFVLCFCSWSMFLYADVLGSLDGEGIIGGSVIDEPHQFPYLVSIQNSTADHWCGGGIIGDQFILTAAHCVIYDQVTFYDFPYLVVAGIDRLDDEAEDTKITHEVEKIYVSERYNHSLWFLSDTPEGDWAVLKLKNKLDIANNEGLRILDLPEKIPETDEYNRYDNTTALLAGYGYDYVEFITYDNGTRADKGNSTGQLHKANVLIVNASRCDGSYNSPTLNSQICGTVLEHVDKSIPQGPCNGDSGSPLVIGNTVIGVLSTSGLGCDDNAAPSKYTRVSSHVQDIKNVMNGIEQGLRVKTVTNF